MKRVMKQARPSTMISDRRRAQAHKRLEVILNTTEADQSLISTVLFVLAAGAKITKQKTTTKQ